MLLLFNKYYVFCFAPQGNTAKVARQKNEKFPFPTVVELEQLAKEIGFTRKQGAISLKLLGGKLALKLPVKAPFSVQSLSLY